MKYLNLMLIPLFYISPFAHADTIIGQMEKSGHQFEVKTLSNDFLELDIPFKYKKYLPSLTSTFFSNLTNAKNQAYPVFYLSFNGEIKNGKLKVDRTPMTMSAPKLVTGKLILVDGKYTINQKVVKFENAELVNGSAFNQKSIDFYIGKEISALIKQDYQGNSVITALVPKHLFSADDSVSTAPSNITMKGITRASRIEKMNTYLLKTIFSNDASARGDSFRQTIFSKKQIVPGDKALIITLSGRQGDDPGAVAGHYAAGMATVKSDMSLDMELWNYYGIPNEKLIMSGHNHFIDYYGHVTAGQANYRPTYTLVLYGVDEKIMKKMRAELDHDFYQMREALKDFGVYYSCTTETVSALRSQDFTGTLYSNPATHIFKKLGALALSPFEILSYPFTRKLTELRYSVQYDANKYVPRIAFTGILKNLKKLEKEFSITRADYVFQQQTPSGRPVGGAPSQGLMTVASGKGTADDILENPSDWTLSSIHSYIEKLMLKDQN